MVIIVRSIGNQMLVRANKTAAELISDGFEQLKELCKLEPGQVIYVDDPTKLIIPDYGDNSEEHY